MKICINSRFKKPLLLAAIVTLPMISFAQPDPTLDPDEPVPVDGGISLLVAAGIGYGAKKLHDAKKKRNNAIEK